MLTTSLRSKKPPKAGGFLLPKPYRLWYNKASMDPNQQGQSNAGAPSAPNSGANIPATGASTPSAGTPAAGTPPPVFSGAGAPTSGVPVAPGPTAPATPTATPAGSSARRFFGASNRPGSAASAGQPASGIYSGNPTPGIITSAPAASGAAGGKKLSKGMIVGLIVIAILAIAAVVVGVIASNSSSNKSGDSSNSASAPINMSELKTAYNNLANYIAFGDENTSEKKLSDGKTYSTEELLGLATTGLSNGPILEADTILASETSVRKTEYFKKFDQLYQQLPDDLSVQYNVNAEDIYDYFHEFSTVGIISDASIISRYNTEGFDLTKAYIENTVTTKSDKRYVIEYANYLRDYNLSALNLINDVKINLGCTVELNNTNKCNIESVASHEAYNTSMMRVMAGDAYKIKAGYQGAAVQALLNIHKVVDETSGGER